MAEEEKREKKKSKKSIFLIVAVLVILIIIAVGAFLFLKKGSQNSNTVNNTNTQSESLLNDKNVHIKTFKDIIVNLADPSGDRYLKISLALVMQGKAKSQSGESSGETIEDALIKNTIITILSTKTSENLLTLSGKEELRKQLITAINKALGEDVVKDIYFTDFVVQ